MPRPRTSDPVFVKNRIKEHRVKLGLSQQSLADAVGISVSQLSRWEGQTRSVTADYIDKLADALCVPSSAIVSKTLDREDGAQDIHVNVTGEVNAGYWSESPEWPRDRWYSVIFPPSNQFKDAPRHGLEVKGPSMNRLFPEGSVIVWIPIAFVGGPMRSGKQYVLRQTAVDGRSETTTKTFVRDNKGEEWFIPESDDPKFQEPLRYSDDAEMVEVLGPVVDMYRRMW